MDVLLAPVYESFLRERHACLRAGGFVVGPIGVVTATGLFEECVSRATRSPVSPNRFAFSPLLPGIIYESHTAIGTGGYRFIGLIDEIEINAGNLPYRHAAMKPGRGTHCEHADAERMPAYVRFRTVVALSETVPIIPPIRPADVGQRSAVLRRFTFAEIARTDVKQALEQLAATPPA